MEDGAQAFSRWAAAGVWEKVFADLIKDRQSVSDVGLDRGAGSPTGDDRSGQRPKKGGLDPAVGRSRGGLTTKVHIACDSLGRPIRFLIAPGQSHDILAVPALLEGHRPAAVLADRAYDAGSLRQHLDGIGAEAVIPSTRSRKTPIPHDPLIYKLRNRIERCFNKLSTSAASPRGSTGWLATTSPSSTPPLP